MSARVRIDYVHCAVDGLETVARVRLSHHGRLGSGMASARTTEGVWRQVVAEATLNAVQDLSGGNLQIALDAVAEVASGQYPIVVATMTIGRGRSEVFLSGTAPLTGDHCAAVTKAVLHGLNRWVQPFLVVVSEEPAPPHAHSN